MTREVKITNFTEVRTLCQLAQDIDVEVGVHDANGSVADAKSMLGLMSLDYSKPVEIVCEKSNILDVFVRAIDCHGDLEALFRMMNPSLN